MGGASQRSSLGGVMVERLTESFVLCCVLFPGRHRLPAKVRKRSSPRYSARGVLRTVPTYLPLCT